MAGFNLAKDLFVVTDPASAAPRAAVPGKLLIEEVWFAWTEQPDDPIAQQLRLQRKAGIAALAKLSARLDGFGPERPDTLMLDAAFGFFGVGDAGGGPSDGADLGATAQAMQRAARLAPVDRVRYHQPGTIAACATAPEVRIYVLGPPTDRKSLMKTDSTTEVYGLDT